MRLLISFLFLATVLSFPPVYASTVIDVPIEEDTYIEEKFPTIAPWNNRNLFLGTDTWYAKGKNRILIKPNFANLQNQDILFSDIEKVELIITAYEYEGTDLVATIDSYTTTSPWSMFTATWNIQPSITSKKDSTVITTGAGEKLLTVTNAFIEAFKSYPSYEKGILLKINAETEKAIIFWAHGCDIAPSPPICSGAQDRPRFRITLKQNSLPTLCTLKYPSKTVTLTKEPTIALEPNPSIDFDGNTVSYLGRVCTDVSCEVPLWEANLEVGTKAYTDLADGEYFLSCAAQDGHQGVSWGDSFRLLVDTEPPASPVLVDEPPYTGSLANTLTWLPNSIEIVEYQVLSSERSDFRSYNVYSPWLSENRYIINHTKEKGFYYKVKARDKAGNESLWSNASSTIIDSTIPTIRYFKTNKSVMSPKYSNSGVVTENAYLQGGIEDATIDTLWIEIEDSMQRLVYTERIEDKNYLWTHWPEKSGDKRQTVVYDTKNFLNR